ncbi:magnesium transporter [Aquabacter spiritensis]|uniref:Magnesium transporter MgtE n=1 Tax=Aquabacter spiritensis TaxID=933073 RepID=A0A4R3M2X5_9HYPH|nr:magnesium transporter [Aquabacter spiritensis]TCT07564.1 magnesium transporter [Aquabacter spiritensis]
MKQDTIDAAAISAAPHTLSSHHVADIVELLNHKGLEEAVQFIDRLPDDWAVEIMDQPDFVWACEVMEELPAEKSAHLMEHMSSDRVADLLRWIPEPKRTELKDLLKPDTRTGIDRLLTYPHNSAGSIMTTEFVSVPADWTVEQTLTYLREVEASRETIYAIFLLDPGSKRLVNVVKLRALIIADPKASILSIAPTYAPITANALADREDVARMIAKYDLLAVPVVDTTGHIIGICTFDDMIDAMIDEQTEDVQRMGGMEHIHEPYMQIGFMEMIKKRGGWLCVLFLSEMLTTSAMQVFSDELEKAIVLALFIPLVMSSGGNSGSQATSLIIRALALQQVRLRDWFKVAMRELPTGIVLGAILGVIGIVRIALWQELGIFDYGEHWVLLSITIGVALIGIVTFGSLSGSMLPFILKRLGFDPATASAPFVATLVDVTGIVIYFSVAWLFLHGTIL